MSLEATSLPLKTWLQAKPSRRERGENALESASVFSTRCAEQCSAHRCSVSTMWVAPRRRPAGTCHCRIRSRARSYGTQRLASWHVRCFLRLFQNDTSSSLWKSCCVVSFETILSALTVVVLSPAGLTRNVLTGPEARDGTLLGLVLTVAGAIVGILGALLSAWLL